VKLLKQMANILQQILTEDDHRSSTWNEFNDLYTLLDKVKDETFKEVVDEFDKHEKFTKKYKKLKEIDDAVWNMYTYALEGMNKWCEDDYLFTLNKKLCKTNCITRSKGKEISSNVCSLCLDTHDVKHLIKTSCGHYFGKPCFAALTKHKFENDESHVTCPYCRSNVATLCQFKYKK
jgi:hypothetical protein